MAKAPKAQMILKCRETGVEFPYSGRGRPPHFCPAEQKRRQKAQRDAARARQKVKKAALKLAA